MGKHLRALVATVLFGLAACHSPRAVIGSYIAKDDTSGWLIQITSLEGKTIRGTTSYVSIDDAGKAEAKNRIISGTYEDDALSLTVENGSAVTLMTGSKVEEGLELTIFSEGRSQKFLFAKADASEFPKLIDQLRKHAAELKQAAEAAAVEQEKAAQALRDQGLINKAVSRIDAEASEVADKAAQIDAFISTYARVNARVDDLIGEYRKITYTSSDDSSRMSDVRSAIEQNIQEVDSAHEQVQRYWQNLKQESEETVQSVRELQQKCETLEGVDCSMVSITLAGYQAKVAEFAAKARQENAVYLSERRKFLKPR